MKHVLSCLVPLFVVGLFTASAQAETHADWSGDVYHEKKHVTTFQVEGEGKQKLRLTVSTNNNKSGSGKMRVYFYKRSPQGGWDQIDELRLHIDKNVDNSSDTFHLPAGEYMVQVKVRRMKYSFKLADD